MPKRYQVRSTFAYTFDGDDQPTYFTRDNEWKASKLPEKVLKDMLDKGFIVETELTTAQAAQYDAASLSQSPKAEVVASQAANEPSPAVRRELKKER